MEKKVVLSIAFMFCCFFSVFAGTTGKITGKIIDAESGMPLPGVNVMIDETAMGSATDLNGQFLIMNVPPGKYNLKITIIGYAEYRVEDVRVIIDQTTKVNAKLASVVLAGEDVVVVAERPIVSKDISNSQMNIETEIIENLPVQTVNQVLTLQAGIELGREGILVRGGGANQTAFMVDGLSMNDERSNIPYTAVSLSSIQEIQVQTGGFNAEYGNVRSGLVNVITKEGRRNRYNGSMIFRYGAAKAKNFGPSAYDRDSYFTRPYLDPDVCWTGTNNSKWDTYTQKQYPQFEGWNAVSLRTMQDSDPTNDLTPEGAKRLFEWQHRRQGDITKPDYIVDLSFGGPVPIIGNQLGDLRFYITHFREKDMFVIPLSRDNYGTNHTQIKLNTNISPAIKLTLTGLYGEVHSVSPYQWKTTPTGRVVRFQSEVADLVTSSSGNSILYMPGYFSPASIYRNMAGLKLTHILSPKTFYEISIQNSINRYNTFKLTDRDTRKKYEPVPGYLVDEAPYGYWGYGTTGIDGMSMGGWMNLGRDKSVNSTFSFRSDLTSQITSKNQLKAGIHVVYNDYNVKSTTESPSMNTWTRSMLYHIFPYRIGTYLQDKLEFEGFIANLGLRLDYSDANSPVYNLVDYDDNLKAGYGNSIETNVETGNSQAVWNLSPRFGISHPITDNSKLYFNYGHFRSETASAYRFRLQRESNGLVTNLGDPNLALEKTVAYELGYAQNLFDILLINIAAYYKDVSNQPGWIFYQNINNSVQYSKAANNNYADIRGFEITLTKHPGRWISGFINYTYRVSTSGYFGLLNYYEDPNKQRAYLRQNPYQSRPHPRPYARANVTVHVPQKFGPSLMGFQLLSDWNINVLADWRVGSYYTYNPNSIPGLVDNTQWKDWYNVDLRISKKLSLLRYDFQFYIDVSNVFNTKYMSEAGYSDNYDRLDYLESLNFSWEEGIKKGEDRIGDYRPEHIAYDPLEPNPNGDPAIKAKNDKRKKEKSYIDMPNFRALTFLNPRNITFGLKINF